LSFLQHYYVVTPNKKQQLNENSQAAPKKYSELETAVVVMMLDELFDHDEFLQLCSIVGVEYRALAGYEKKTKVIDLVRYCEEHLLTDKLEEQLQALKKP